ncbi:MAG: DUF1028 domain-containing protein, partial [Phycisphaerales bacterium]
MLYHQMIIGFVGCVVPLGFAGGTDEPHAAPPANPQKFQRPVATYSIVARDPETGEMGVAVQSHWFSVGPIVPWAEA